MTENNYDKLKDAICELVNIAEDATSREVFEILDNAGVDVIDCLDKLSGYEAIGTIEELQDLKEKNTPKELAEEYNNDVCEWEKGSSGYVGYPAYYSKCCTTNSKGLEMQTHIISDWKYCPYCGKKIKIVGD